MNIHILPFIAAAGSEGILSLLLDADIIVQGVLLLLASMSVICWVIIFKKVRRIISAQSKTKLFLDFFWNKNQKIENVFATMEDYESSPVAQVFSKGYTELAKIQRSKSQNPNNDFDVESNIERAMRRAAAEERTKLESMVIFLATTGSTGPFIGLFGTVWGILRAFQKIGETGQANIQTVGPDIAHALIATAVGLAAAIPAVVAYNFINRKIRVLVQEMDNFSSDFINIIKRKFVSR
jgi:biopolymer transport protein TolQ